MKDTWCNDKTERFEVKLPWKVDPVKSSIKSKFMFTKKTCKKSNVLRLFSEQMKEIILHGIFRKTDASYPKCYLLLLAIIKYVFISQSLKGRYEMNGILSDFALENVTISGKRSKL